MDAQPHQDFEPPIPRVEATPRWVRVRAGDQWVADSRRAQLLVWFGPHLLPTYCFPEADVRTDLLRPSAVGDARLPPFLMPHDLHLPGGVLPGVARRFQEPPGELAGLHGHVTFTWDGGVQWFEEAMEVHVHARDPTKRVDVLPSERHVRVELDGQVVAESRRPSVLFETDLPTRWYLPMEDVRSDLLEPSDTTTSCPYKGTARYWSVGVGGRTYPDLAWSYPDPVVECPRIAGLVAFFNEKVDLVVDGVPQERPRTPWS